MNSYEITHIYILHIILHLILYYNLFALSYNLLPSRLGPLFLRMAPGLIRRAAPLRLGQGAQQVAELRQRCRRLALSQLLLEVMRHSKISMLHTMLYNIIFNVISYYLILI